MRADDVERTQYKILAGLQEADKAFGRGALYPHLAELIEFYQNLDVVLERWDDYPEEKDQDFAGVDFEEGKLKYEGEAFAESERVEAVLKLTRWASERTEDVLEKGKELYNTVSGAMSWARVGRVTNVTKKTGLLLVPDHTSSALRTLRFNVRVLGGEGFGTELEEVRTDDLGADPVHVKNEALSENETEAAYLTEVEEEGRGCPFEPTLRPVLRRTFHRRVVEGEK